MYLCTPKHAYIQKYSYQVDSESINLKWLLNAKLKVTGAYSKACIIACLNACQHQKFQEFLVTNGMVTPHQLQISSAAHHPKRNGK